MRQPARADRCVCAILAAAFSLFFASDGEAQNCNLPPPAERVVWAWGFNYFGQLGDGTTNEQHAPVQVQNLSGIMAIAAGLGHSLALKNDGTLWAWGENPDGAVGDGTTTDRHSPVQVQNLSGIMAIAAGWYHSLAVTDDGVAWAWGRNDGGQLGDGTDNNWRTTPVQVLNLRGIRAVAAGAFHNLALTNDGTVWAWGENFHGELGDGTSGNIRSTPVQVQNLSGVTAVAAGLFYSLALKNDGTVWAWGANDYGQLGDGSLSGRPTAGQVQNLSGVTAVAAGTDGSSAVRNDGTVWTWGVNAFDQHTTPVQFQNFSGATVVATDGHSLALKNDCTVWAWGHNGAGQLGDGTTNDRQTPVQVKYSSGVTAVAVGLSHSLAVAPPLPKLTVFKILVHPDHNHLRLFNLTIDGVVVRANVNGGSTGPRIVSPGSHTVSETGGAGTHIGAFGSVISGDCAADGTVELALRDRKTCTITNYDHTGGCSMGSSCCEPGDDTQGCQQCVSPPLACR